MEVDVETDGSCCGCFVYLLVMPVMMVAVYVVWRWAFTFMGLA